MVSDKTFIETVAGYRQEAEKFRVRAETAWDMSERTAWIAGASLSEDIADAFESVVVRMDAKIQREELARNIGGGARQYWLTRQELWQQLRGDGPPAAVRPNPPPASCVIALVCGLRWLCGADPDSEPRADFYGARLSGTDFRCAQFPGADFRDTCLLDVDFCDAQLDGADFRGSVFLRVDLRGARIRDAIFDDATLNETGKRLVEDDAPGAGAVASRPRGVAGDRCGGGNQCGRTGCEECQA